MGAYAPIQRLKRIIKMDSKQLVAELIKGNVEEFKKGFSELLAERIEEKMCKLRAESLSDVGLKVLGDEEVEPELEDGQEMLTEPEMEDEEESLFGNIKSIRNTRETVKNLEVLALIY